MEKGVLFFETLQQNWRLCGENAGATGSLDLLLGVLAEKSGLDDDGLGGQTALAEDLEDSLKIEKCRLAPSPNYHVAKHFNLGQGGIFGNQPQFGNQRQYPSAMETL